jgi:CRISPR-associated protein Cas2
MGKPLNGYRLMWIMVMFDLPVVKAEERKVAAKFRNFLEKQGFGMCQYSVYAKYVGPREKLESLSNLIKSNIPEKGRVNILTFTDKQFGKIVILENNKRKPSRENPEQLLIFSDSED